MTQVSTSTRPILLLFKPTVIISNAAILGRGEDRPSEKAWAALGVAPAPRNRLRSRKSRARLWGTGWPEMPNRSFKGHTPVGILRVIRRDH